MNPNLKEIYRQAIFNERLNQARQGKLSAEEVQHLRRMGVALPASKKRERPIRRLAVWWETTPCEKFLEDIAFLLKNAAIIDVINLTASIAIILSLTSWWLGRQERRENELFSTWGVLQSASNDRSGVAKIAAERLNRKGFSLEGLDLEESVLTEARLDGANLSRANLSGADLSRANLADSILEGSNLNSADLEEAILKSSDLEDALLGGANLVGANLQDASLRKTDLRASNLENANLQDSNLEGAELRVAGMAGTNLTNTNLRETNLWGVDLNTARLHRTNLQDADLKRALNLSEEQLSYAKLCRTTLPSNVSLDPNRDCEAMGINPVSGTPTTP